MALHTTVVYYPADLSNAEAFHVINTNRDSLQAAFNEHDIHTIKCITIETETLGSKTFRTIFTESDISSFLKLMHIDFL